MEPTDSKSIASLLDSECDIPFDVHFEIEDDDGNKLETLGGHKALLALKSPVFKAMLFGPMKESGKVVKIKGTTVFAFKTLLFYIHEVEEEWWPWTIDVHELVRIVDLAQRFNLAGLKRKAIGHVVRVFSFPKEQLLEVARVAEEHHMHTDLSESLLQECAGFVIALVETPEDFNGMVKEWSQGSPEETGTALRLLARVDQRKLVYNLFSCEKAQKVMHSVLIIARFIQPRARLNQVKKMLEDFDHSSLQIFLTKLRSCYQKFDLFLSVILRSLWMCQKHDAEDALKRGITLELDTPVEAEFTHGTSVQLHLDLLVLTKREDHKLDEAVVHDLWKELLRAIDDVKPIILAWFSDHRDIFDAKALFTLSKKLSSCEDPKLLSLPLFDLLLNA